MSEPKLEFTFTKVDIPTSNMEKMLSFYAEVFDVDFQEFVENMNAKEWKLYAGHLGDITFLLCPNEPSGTEANQPGVHQFHLRISNLPKFIESIKKKGYKVEKVPFGEGTSNYCLRDPDGHPWILSD